MAGDAMHEDESWYPSQWSYLCPQCGKFLPFASVRCEDYWDPGAYYGVSTRYTATCNRCGEVEPIERVTAVSRVGCLTLAGED